MTDAVSLSNDEARALDRCTRGWCDVLGLWRLCGGGACRRARACRGEPRRCLKSNFPLLPDGVRAWFLGIGEAQDEKLAFDEAMEWLDSTGAGEAFRAWTHTVDASVRKPGA